MLLVHLIDDKLLAHDIAKCIQTLFLDRKIPLHICESGSPVLCLQHPVGFWPELVNLILAIDNHGKSRGLDTPDTENITIATVFDRVES